MSSVGWGGEADNTIGVSRKIWTNSCLPKVVMAV